VSGRWCALAALTAESVALPSAAVEKGRQSRRRSGKWPVSSRASQARPVYAAWMWLCQPARGLLPSWCQGQYSVLWASSRPW